MRGEFWGESKGSRQPWWVVWSGGRGRAKPPCGHWTGGGGVGQPSDPSDGGHDMTRGRDLIIC